jgi:UDP-2,3-diacylglucosamine pyrophosphatase LpxH
MSSTLLISDLHLGAWGRGSVLEQPAPLAQLIDAIARHDRLVLLGDAVELTKARPSRALDAAEPILRAIGAALGPDRTVVLVPGNHDHDLVRGWALAQGGRLGVDSSVPVDSNPMLARIAEWLAPARLEVRYPGVWLSETIWATHGHYLNRHLLPVSSYGLIRGQGLLPAGTVPPSDYERFLRPQLSQALRWLPRPLAAGLEDLGELLRVSTMPGVEKRILHRRLAPLTSRLLGIQMRRHSLPAIARVARDLGVDAEVVVFGHVHRLGPLAGDDPEEWRGPGNGPRLLNTGSWRYDPLLLHHALPPHPYWPGGAVVVEDGAEPRAIGLLDGLAADQLHPARVVF